MFFWKACNDDTANDSSRWESWDCFKEFIVVLRVSELHTYKKTSVYFDTLELDLRFQQSIWLKSRAMVIHTRKKCGYIWLDLQFCLQCAVFMSEGSNLHLGGNHFILHRGHTIDKIVDFPIKRHSYKSFLVQQQSDESRRGLGFVISKVGQGICLYNKKEYKTQTWQHDEWRRIFGRTILAFYLY